MPWVRRAAVRREWPNKLVVVIDEHKPLGTWGEDGKLISVEGDLFTANLAEAEEEGDLPEFAGRPASEREVAPVTAISRSGWRRWNWRRKRSSCRAVMHGP